MKVYLLVEGNTDLAFFLRILPHEIQPETTIITSGGRSNIASKARSLMVTKRRPLALVADAEVVEKDAVEQRLNTLEELIRPATAGIPYKVILAVPEIESWFFVVPEVLERLSGKKLSPEQRELGELRPKEVLRQLFEDQGPFSVDTLARELTQVLSWLAPSVLSKFGHFLFLCLTDWRLIPPRSCKPLRFGPSSG